MRDIDCIKAQNAQSRLDILKNNLKSWPKLMALQHCGQDYGSDYKNMYHFYRKVYHMNAKQADDEAKRWCGMF